MRSDTRSFCMSMPYTSQSVVSMMRLDKWWPMKPLTPRMQIFFMGEEIDSVEKPHRRCAAGPLEGALVEHCTVHFQRKDAQRRAVTAFGVAAPAVAIQRRKA